MISIKAREAMEEIEEAAEEHLDDIREFRPHVDYYETALDTAFDYGCTECLEEFTQRLQYRVKKGNPPDKTGAYRFVRKMLLEHDHELPAHLEIHRAGTTSGRDPWH